jgi:DNA-binding NarL/FixJ family response regulator
MDHMLLLSIALVEDQALVRGLAVEGLLEHFGRTRCAVGGFSCVEDLLATDRSYDVVLLDLQLKGGGVEGNDAVRVLTERGLRVVVLSGLASWEAVEGATGAGAWGFVTKDIGDIADVAAAVVDVHAGRRHLQPALLEKLIATGRRALTARQQQVLRLEALGLTIGQIARALDPPLKQAGVKRHIEKIVESYPQYRKQASRVQLAIWLGLVTPWEVYRRPGGPPTG